MGLVSAVAHKGQSSRLSHPFSGEGRTECLAGHGNLKIDRILAPLEPAHRLHLRPPERVLSPAPGPGLPRKRISAAAGRRRANQRAWMALETILRPEPWDESSSQRRARRKDVTAAYQ